MLDLDKLNKSRFYFSSNFSRFPTDIQDRIQSILTKLNKNELLRDLEHSLLDEVDRCEMCFEPLKFRTIDDKFIFNKTITQGFTITDNDDEEETLLCVDCLRHELFNWI